ncbi:MAG: NERD domain-containing protein [Planctomycetota bacterium]
MAQMVPERDEGEVDSRAERLVRRALSERLPDDWTVVHGARWVGRRHGRDGQDGEIDFLLLHPKHGAVVLEVKGGTVARERQRWTSTSTSGQRHDLGRGPLQQAHDGKYALRALLENMRRFRAGTPHLVHAALLPESHVPDTGLGADAPRALLGDARDLAMLEEWVQGVVAHTDRHPAARELGKEGVRAIVELLAPRRTLTRSRAGENAGVDVELLELTERQYRVLDLTRSLPRVLVEGGPGTGKSLIAVEAARRFAAAGRSTLLLCYNGPLAGRLVEEARGIEGVTATHFHGLCRAWAAEAGLTDLVDAAQAAGDWTEGFANVLLEAASALHRSVDAIVVDEGQDFDPSWWPVLEQLLSRGDGIFYVFADPGQALRGDAARPPLEGLHGPLELDRNCRNPAEVHAWLQAVDTSLAALRGSNVTTGVPPSVRWVGPGGDVAAVIDAAVKALVQDHGLAPGDIAVITPRGRERSVLKEVDTLGGAPASWKGRDSADHVWIDTTHRHKGLDHRGVVVCELGPDLKPDLMSHLRVACSRATHRLDVVAAHALAPVFQPARDLATWSGVLPG